MIWIQPELEALESGHGMRDGQTDGRTEWNQYTPPQQLRCASGIIISYIFLEIGITRTNATENIFEQQDYICSTTSERRPNGRDGVS